MFRPGIAELYWTVRQSLPTRQRLWAFILVKALCLAILYFSLGTTLSPAALSRLYARPLLSCDPYDYPGILHFDPSDALSIRWDPFSPSCQPLPLAAWLSSRELPPPISRRLRDKTVVLVGDSIDRQNLERACQLAKGSLEVIGPDHLLFPQPGLLSEAAETGGWKASWTTERSWPRLCRFRDVGLSLISVFHWGMDEEDAFRWKDQWTPPNSFEDRVDQILVPLIANMTPGLVAKPSIISFASGLWDLARWGREDDALASASLSQPDSAILGPTPNLSPARLDQYFNRSLTALTALHQAFPDLPPNCIIVRVLHQPPKLGKESEFQRWWQPGAAEGSVHAEYFSANRIRDVNAVQKEAVRRLKEDRGKVTGFDRWGELLYSQEDLFDEGDPHPRLEASGLWLDMMMHRLLALE